MVDKGYLSIVHQKIIVVINHEYKMNDYNICMPKFVCPYVSTKAIRANDYRWAVIHPFLEKKSGSPCFIRKKIIRKAPVQHRRHACHVRMHLYPQAHEAKTVVPSPCAIEPYSVDDWVGKRGCMRRTSHHRSRRSNGRGEVLYTG